MDNKYLRVTMPDGSQWDIPAEIVADDRAKYYAKIDTDTTYKEEYEYTLSDDSEIFDWAANNMNWDDVKDHAVKVSEYHMTAADFQEGWVNGEKEIIEKGDGRA
jgi:hypothetical protein